MNQVQTTEEEVTTVHTQSPSQVIRKTTSQAEPQAKGAAPQSVYETKKTIFRSNQIIWYILGLIEVLLVFRIVLKAVGANATSGFANFIYALTGPLADPFRGILASSVTDSSVFEWSTILAASVYLCVAWGLVYLLELIYPITPRDVETQ